MQYTNNLQSFDLIYKNDNAPQNSECRSRGYGDEIIENIIIEYSKRRKKSKKTKHDLVGMVIYTEL